MNISEDNLEKIAEISETIDNLFHAMQIPMPAEFHLKALKASFPDLIKKLRGVYTETKGESEETNTSVYIMPQMDWIEIKACPDCQSLNIKWYLSATKECKDCKNVFRAHELIPINNGN